LAPLQSGHGVDSLQVTACFPREGDGKRMQEEGERLEG